MKNNWLFSLDEDVQFEVGWMKHETQLTEKWFTIRGGVCTILKGYAWDGCSPKGVFWSTWDGWVEDSDLWVASRDYCGPVKVKGKPTLYIASCVHDALYQFIVAISTATGMSVWEVRRHADNTFGDICKAAGWTKWKAYRRFVRWFGWMPVLKRTLRKQDEPANSGDGVSGER